MQEQRTSTLLCRVGELLCALPLEHVQETLRPLPVEPLAGVPSFVRGVSVIRGTVTPVVDAKSLLSGGSFGPLRRFVTLKTGARPVALAVDDVLGIKDIPPASLDALPALLGDAPAGAIAAMGTLDSALLIVLSAARVVPESAWSTIEAGAPA